MLRGFRTTSALGSEAADVSRMLEPYYAAPPALPRYGSASSASSPSSSAGSSPSQATAWVDAAGHLHDPDYRAFAPLPGRRASAPDADLDNASDDAHTRFWKQQRRAAARRASLPLLTASTRPAEPVNFYHRPSFEESVVWDDPPYALRSTFALEAEPESKTPEPYVYTCTDTLRFQFEALKLSFRMRLFRARRRWRERRESMSSTA